MDVKCRNCGYPQVEIDETVRLSARCPKCKANVYLPEKFLEKLGEEERKSFETEGQTLMKYIGGGGRVVVPFTVKYIAENAFDRNKTLQEIYLPASVESVGNRTFQGCLALKKIHLPDGLKNIGESAFFRCPSLTEAHIPQSVSHVGKYAFMESGLTEVSFADGAERLVIGERAFADCKNLYSAILPKRVSVVGAGCFSGCTQLSKAVVSEADIGDNAFSGCTKLTLNVRDKKGLFAPKWWNKNFAGKTAVKVVWGFKE